MNSKIPKVFISYSWDNETHQEWVLKLAKKLCENGVDVFFDKYDLRAGRDMNHFMENSVRESDRVLLIMTPNYKVKAENRKGGVGNEVSMIRAEKFNCQETEKFIPIVRLGNREECTPLFAKSLVDIDMSIEDDFENSFEELLRTIYEEPKNEKPPLGKKPQFAKRKIIEKEENVNFVVIKGVKWATCNVGNRGVFVSEPENYGEYYTWEEAKNACPHGWRLPTNTEFQSLINVGSTWAIIKGVRGRLFGTAPNQIFLPATGINGTTAVNDQGYYWSSEKAYSVRFTSGLLDIYDHSKLTSLRFPIRCVVE